MIVLLVIESNRPRPEEAGSTQPHAEPDEDREECRVPSPYRPAGFADSMPEARAASRYSQPALRKRKKR